MDALQKESVIATLGNHYSNKVIEWLNHEKEIFNENGMPFSKESIRQIVNGKQNNLKVEIAIAELVSDTKKRIERKNKLLKK